MKQGLFVLIVAGLITTLFYGCANSLWSEGADSTSKNTKPEKLKRYKLTIAHEEGPNDLQDVYANKFKELIEKKSNGKIQVDVYTRGQLGSDQDLLENLKMGVIDFAISSPGTTGSLIPEAQIFSLHFLFSHNMDINKQILNESQALNGTLAKIYEKENLKVLDWWTEGFMYWTSNKPIQTPDVFDGFKMRTMESPLILESYQAYGANPTPMPFSEVYTSLQLNIIDGQENPAFYIHSSYLHEVQDYIIDSRHNLYVTSTITNKNKYESLPKDVRFTVMETMEELKDFSFDMQAQMNNKAMKKIQKSSDIQVIKLSTEQMRNFKKLSKPMRERYVKMVGGQSKEILDMLVKEIAKAEKAKQ